MKKCKTCRKLKPLENFYKQGKYYISECKNCRLARSHKWAKENVNKNRAKALRYFNKTKQNKMK